MNPTSNSILAPMLNLFPRKRKGTDKLDIITWNVHVGHNPDHVKSTLEHFAKEYNPHIIALQEATNVHGIRLKGYRVFHLPKDHPHNLYPEDADTALIIRNDLSIHGHRVRRMTKKWKGPDHGFIHEPRVYQMAWISTSLAGELWKIGVGHWPFGEAQRETIQYLTQWFRHTVPGRPSVFVGDLNAMPADFVSITDLGNVKVVGHRIDQAICRNVKSATARDIGAFGSDHDAVLIHLEA